MKIIDISFMKDTDIKTFETIFKTGSSEERVKLAISIIENYGKKLGELNDMARENKIKNFVFCVQGLISKVKKGDISLETSKRSLPHDFVDSLIRMREKEAFELLSNARENNNTLSFLDFIPQEKYADFVSALAEHKATNMFLAKNLNTILPVNIEAKKMSEVIRRLLDKTDKETGEILAKNFSKLPLKNHSFTDLLTLTRLFADKDKKLLEIISNKIPTYFKKKWIEAHPTTFTGEIKTENDNSVADQIKLREKLSDYQRGLERQANELRSRECDRDSLRYLLDEIAPAIEKLEKELDALTENPSVDKLQELNDKIMPLPQKMERARVMDIFLKRRNQLQENSVMHIPRSRYRELTFSYMVIEEEGDVKIYQQFHKNKRFSNQIREFWHGTTEGKRTKLAEGGMKKIYQTKSLDTGEAEYVRSVAAGKRIPPGSIEAAKVFKNVKRICIGHYLSYEKIDDRGEIIEKEALLTPFMEADLLSLAERLAGQEGEKATRIKLQAMIQMAEGLKAVHDKGWIHLDVKLPNYFVNNPEDPENIDVRLSDFDFAMKPQHNREQIPPKGSRFSMAPELTSLEAFGPEGGKKADIYSLGIALWHLEIGRVPRFIYYKTDNGYKYCAPARTKQKLAQRLKTTNFPPEEERTDLQKLVINMIDPDPLNRPEIDEVIARLTAIYDNHFKT